MDVNISPQPLSPSAAPRGFDVGAGRDRRAGIFGLSKRILLISIFLLVLVSLVYLGFFIWHQSLNRQQDKIEAKMQEINAKIVIDQDLQKEMVATNEAINSLKSLLRNHIVSSSLFKLVEDHTSIKVQWSSLNFSAPQLAGVNIQSGGLASLSLDGTTQTYLLVGRQLRVFEQMPEVSSVELSQLSQSEHGIDFGLKIELNPELFLLKVD